MSSSAPWLIRMMHQEPIIVWSCLIGGVGILLPVVVPPIRESLSTRKSQQPPPIKQLIEDVSKKQ
eukprot:jgi/Botrbrau1/8609/Bobra.0196s0009.1